tara:strand:+ start:4254 stop:4418 length:165 start_codon:yes stop_codon:yes gene_type:complete
MTKIQQIDGLTTKLAQAAIKIKMLKEVNQWHQELNGKLREEIDVLKKQQLEGNG